MLWSASGVVWERLTVSTYLCTTLEAVSLALSSVTHASCYWCRSNRHAARDDVRGSHGVPRRAHVGAHDATQVQMISPIGGTVVALSPASLIFIFHNITIYYSLQYIHYCNNSFPLLYNLKTSQNKLIIKITR